MRILCWRSFFLPITKGNHPNPFPGRNCLVFNRSFTRVRDGRLKVNYLPNSHRWLHVMNDPSTSPLSEKSYYPEADVENLEGYVPGGFHPAMIGDTFHGGRYRIVHKLGCGGYSMVWLARDQQLQRYVSLKILVASASGNSNESNILRLLQNGNSGHPGKQFIQTLLDEFKFEGLNGQHLCLVGVPYGYSISRSKEDSVNFMFPVDAARSAAAQLIMGLLYLHANGICHEGNYSQNPNSTRTLRVLEDLHLRNFLLRIPNFDSWTTEELYQHHGKPCEVRIRRIDGKAPGPHAPPRDLSHDPKLTR